MLTGTLPDSWSNFTSVSLWQSVCIFPWSHCNYMLWTDITLAWCEVTCRLCPNPTCHGETIGLHVYCLLNVVAHNLDNSTAACNIAFQSFLQCWSPWWPALQLRAGIVQATATIVVAVGELRFVPKPSFWDATRLLGWSYSGESCLKPQGQALSHKCSCLAEQTVAKPRGGGQWAPIYPAKRLHC